MNAFDIVLIVILALFAYEGFRRGFFRETLNMVGIVIVVYLSFLLMTPLGNIMYRFLPIITLSIVGVEIEAMSILVYQIIAFVLLIVILYILWNFILNITGLLARIIGLNKFLRLPFKILGGVVGIVSGYIVLFILLLALAIPLNNKFTSFRDSKIKNHILNNKVLLIKPVKKVSKSIDEIYDLSERISDDNQKMKHSKKYNAEVMDIMLKNKIISIETVDKLIKENKIHTYDDLNKVFKKYRKN